MSALTQVQYIVVDNIRIEGNKKTKAKVILREIDIQLGDTIELEKMNERIQYNQKRILSTALFTLVNINIKNWNTEIHTADILITVQEHWYIYPSLIFELADRSFNVWWREHNRSLSRVNYGLRLDHINLSGNRDRFKIVFQTGYTKKLEAQYRYPFIKNNWGLTTNIFYSDNKEAGYITQNNKTLFYKAEDERKMRSRFRTGFTLNNRSGLYWHQSFSIEYHHNTIGTDIAADRNPDYFLDGRTRIRFFLFNYDLQYDRREYVQYPQGGYLLFVNLKKEGFGIFGEYDNLSIYGGFEKYIRPVNKLVVGARVKAKTNLTRDKVAFANNTALGYSDDLIRGYELYVMDGTDYLLTQLSAKVQIFQKVFSFGKYMPLNQLRKMDVKLFLRFGYDFGYVNEPTYVDTNTLNNQWVSGYGPAIDLMIYNTFIFSFEYNFNDEFGEHGLYFKTSNAF